MEINKNNNIQIIMLINDIIIRCLTNYYGKIVKATNNYNNNIGLI